MTKFITFASGSGGNCSLYISGQARILIDAGTTTKYIASCLRGLRLELKDLTHVLITHGHGDHIKALPVLEKHTHAELVCSEDTYYSLPAQWRNSTVFDPGDAFELLGCPVNTFSTPHDAPGSCGYVLGEGRRRLAYCTDLGEVLPDIFYAMAGSELVFIESNHDVDMLRMGPYPQSLKKRILSPRGHLSNARCAQTVAGLARQGTRRVILAHLSEENNTPELALSATRSTLEELGALAGDVEVSVAPVAALARPVAMR